MRYMVVEHWEERVTRWLLEEYLETVRIAMGAGVTPVFTNVTDPGLASVLARHGALVDPRPGWERFNTSHTIVLDLEAPRILEPWDLAVAEAVVIGGIMGDHPPRGRTRLISSMYTQAAKRSLGPHQFSVDGAARVVAEVLRGRRIGELRVQFGVTIPVRQGRYEFEVYLPFAYLLGEDGQPLIPEGVRRLLERGIVWDELEG